MIPWPVVCIIMTGFEHKFSNLSQNPPTKGPVPVGYTPTKHQIICGDIDMRIDREGLWHYQGSPIGRKELIRLFASVLHRDEVGDHWLITPAEICRITVDDSAFLAVEMNIENDNDVQKIQFRTNLDEIVILDEHHPLWIKIDPDTEEPRPYIVLEGGFDARLTRSVFYELVDNGVEQSIDREHIYGVWSNHSFFPIGKRLEE